MHLVANTYEHISSLPIRSDFQSALKSGGHNSNMYYITYSFQVSPSICQMT